MLEIWCQIQLKWFSHLQDAQERKISHLQNAQDLVPGLGQVQDLVRPAAFLCRPVHGFVPSGWYTIK